EFEPEEIPFIAESRQRLYQLSLDEVEINIAAVSMGNPHAVQIVKNIDETSVSETGSQIEHHPRFPQRANAGFMQILGRQAIRLRVWERGSGETLACGTGACAAVAAGIDQGLLDSPVKVFLRGGSLDIEWAGDDAPVLMTGPAEYVYEGMFEMEKL
ncbi:MAG TPA: diaminopimelate epimerase, partial [Gammaproteobacteria bacterium]|nr:diaminopimelate epimerase [Gammaproteobacteria bacterium]